MDEWRELVAKEISVLWLFAGLTFGVTALTSGLVIGGIMQYFTLGVGIFTMIASAIIKEKVQKKLIGRRGGGEDN